MAGEVGADPGGVGRGGGGLDGTGRGGGGREGWMGDRCSFIGSLLAGSSSASSSD